MTSRSEKGLSFTVSKSQNIPYATQNQCQGSSFFFISRRLLFLSQYAEVWQRIWILCSIFIMHKFKQIFNNPRLLTRVKGQHWTIRVLNLKKSVSLLSKNKLGILKSKKKQTSFLYLSCLKRVSPLFFDEIYVTLWVEFGIRKRYSLQKGKDPYKSLYLYLISGMKY